MQSYNSPNLDLHIFYSIPINLVSPLLIYIYSTLYLLSPTPFPPPRSTDILLYFGHPSFIYKSSTVTTVCLSLPPRSTNNQLCLLTSHLQIHVFTMPIPYPLCLGPGACPRPWAGRPGGSSRCAGSHPGRPLTGLPPSSAPPTVSWQSVRAPKQGLPGQTGPLMEIFSGAS